MNLNRWAKPTFQGSSRLWVIAGALVVIGVLPLLATAQEGPAETISPLRVESDPNGVNIATGKARLNLPILADPADRIYSASTEMPEVVSPAVEGDVDSPGVPAPSVASAVVDTDISNTEPL
jgi:hypothetical protein